MQKNCLALDIGEKRIGMAVGSTIPFGRGVLDGTNKSEAMVKIKELITNEGIETIIIGLPKVRSGEMTQSQKIVYDWAKQLKEETQLPIELVDESYSSIAAENELRSHNVDTKHEKWRIDERAAEIILEQYLTSLYEKNSD